MELYNESINNYIPTKTHLHIFGRVELGCIYCLKFYEVVDERKLYYNHGTLLCEKCGKCYIIPIISESSLVRTCKNQNERLSILHAINKQIYPLSKL